MRIGGSSSDTTAPQSNTTEVTYHYSPFNEDYTFLVNTDTCAVLNGDEIVAQEINRAHDEMEEIYNREGNISGDIALVLYLKNEGAIDTFRVATESFMLRQTGCRTFYYVLSENRWMDRYGLGNVLYGYFSIVVNEWTSHTIADIIQWNEDQMLNPQDDEDQSDLGRSIATSGQYVSASLVQSLIPTDFTNSK